MQRYTSYTLHYNSHNTNTVMATDAEAEASLHVRKRAGVRRAGRV